MKRLLNFTTKCVWFFSAVFTINRLIFRKAERKSFKVKDEQFYDSAYGKIRYFTAGEGKPLLLIHGIYPGASLLEWEKSIKVLSKRYKVYAIDLLGFGCSAKPKMTYSAYLYVTLINSFIEDVIKEKTRVIASLNSGAFAVLANSFKPDNIEKLMLICPSGIGNVDKYSKSLDLYYKWFANSPVIGTFLYLIMTSKAGIKYFLEDYCFGHGYKISLSLVNKLYSSAHSGGSNTKYPISALMSKFLNVSIESKIKNIKVPVHIIWGTSCKINPVENAHIIEAINPDIQFSYFNGGKLMPHVEFAEQFNTVCLRFLESDND